MSDLPAERPTTGQRISAILALMALSGVVLVLVGALFNRLGVLLVSLLALSAAVVGSWYVLSRRGARRVVAIVTVLAGVAVFVGVMLASSSGWVLTVTLVLAVVSVAATESALPAAPTTSRAGTPAPKPVRPVLLMNPRSGGGKAEKFDLPARCRERGIEPIVLQPGDDLLALAEDAVDRGADVIGMAGGDGSQALVASVASKHGVPHVVVPAGTRNHFALDLGLDRDDVVGALDAFSDATERVIDLAEVNGRVFVNNASMGLYAKVEQSAEYRDAKIATAADVLPDILGPDAVPLDLRFTLPSGDEADTAQLVLVSNNAYRLDRLRGAGTRARLDEGVLGVASVRVGGATDVEKLVALEAVGQVRRFSGWDEWTTATFEVRSDQPVDIGVDGEALSLDPPLIFAIRAGALRVRLPRTALGLSPAAQKPRRSVRETVPDLVKVVRGRRVGTS
jgi:diacylglycerol kinase family enzyme